jgi:hypothetical protein
LAVACKAGTSPRPVDATAPADAAAAGSGGGGSGGPGGGAGGSGGGGTGGVGGSAPVDAPRPAIDAGGPRDAAGEAVRDSAVAADTAVAGGCPFQLCEDFETVADGALPDPATWQRAGFASGTMEVVSNMAMRGRKSLHIKTPAAPSETFLRETRTFPAMGNAFYGRLFFYVDRKPNAFVHWGVVEARGTGNNNRIRYGGIANGGPPVGNNWFLFNIQRLGANETGLDDDANPIIPPRTWVCMEWTFNGATNEARLWWDGTERPKVHWKGTDPQFAMPMFREVNIGWALYQNIEAGYEVWIDAIAIDSQKIGCDR